MFNLHFSLANWFDPAFVPVSRRAAAWKSSPLVGEIVRYSGHERRFPLQPPLLASQPENSHPASGEDQGEGGGRKVEGGRWWGAGRFLAREPENSRPASGEDLGMVKLTPDKPGASVEIRCARRLARVLIGEDRFTPLGSASAGFGSSPIRAPRAVSRDVCLRPAPCRACRRLRRRRLERRRGPNPRHSTRAGPDRG